MDKAHRPPRRAVAGEVEAAAVAAETRNRASHPHQAPLGEYENPASRFARDARALRYVNLRCITLIYVTFLRYITLFSKLRYDFYVTLRYVTCLMSSVKLHHHHHHDPRVWRYDAAAPSAARAEVATEHRRKSLASRWLAQSSPQSSAADAACN